jgi:hypothetical protein
MAAIIKHLKSFKPNPETNDLTPINYEFGNIDEHGAFYRFTISGITKKIEANNSYDIQYNFFTDISARYRKLIPAINKFNKARLDVFKPFLDNNVTTEKKTSTDNLKIEELDFFNPELEPDKRFKRLKNNVRKNFKWSTQRTHEALTELTLELFIYDRTEELIKVSEFAIEYDKPRGKFCDPFFDDVIILYLYTMKHKCKGDTYFKALEFHLDLGPLRWDDLFENAERNLEDIKAQNLGAESVIGRLNAILLLALMDLPFGNKSRFGVEFLENKVQTSLHEIRALRKIIK